jgi:hypothetical protein
MRIEGLRESYSPVNSTPILAPTPTEKGLSSSSPLQSLKDISSNNNSLVDYMKKIVYDLSEIPRYSLNKAGMDEAFRYIDNKFKEMGFGENLNKDAVIDYGTLAHQEFSWNKDLFPGYKHLEEIMPSSAKNLIVSFGSKKQDAEVIVIGGHYDTDSSEMAEFTRGLGNGFKEHANNDTPLKDIADLVRSTLVNYFNKKGISNPEVATEIKSINDIAQLPHFNRGADDNASAVAGVLASASLLKRDKAFIEKLAQKNIRIECVAFANEEAPFFNHNLMGSQIHAKSLKKTGAKVQALIYEMIGYFDDKEGSQNYPAEKLLKLFYPKKGDFIGVVANHFPGSIELARNLKRTFEKSTSLPASWLAFVEKLLPPIGFSDHKSYWDQGYKAVMITDTSYNRNKNYHVGGDDPEKLDYVRMAEVPKGVMNYLKNIIK